MSKSGFFNNSGSTSTTENTIQGSVDAAAASATAAASSETDAQTAQAASEAARDASQTAQVASETAKTASEAARDAAASSQSATAADVVSTNADAASTASDRTAAASSASSASTSAATATTKASEASTSASNAASSLSSFNAVYSTGSSDPTSNLDTGDLFYNSSAGALKVYTGTAWEQGVTAGSGFLPLIGGGLTGNLTTTALIDGRDVAADGTKLDGIEASATADQTATEIRSLVESASDSNVFTDADHSKLNAIEASATADQTAAEIRALVESASDSNVFTDADHSKLNAIEASADVTDTANVVAALTAGTGISIAGNGTIANTASTDLVSDTSPELGGDLQSNGNDINFGDNDKAIFGAGSDLQIYHDGSNSYISDEGTGDLNIRASDDLRLQVNSGGSWINSIICNDAAAVDLYHNNNLKLSTTSSGVSVTGTVAATSFTGDGSSLTGIAAGATGGGSDQIFYENGQTVTADYTITDGKNAMSAGPITINSGTTVTVGTGETWTVV